MLRNTCNTLQQSATKLIISNLSTDKILSLTKQCHHFFGFYGLNLYIIMRIKQQEPRTKSQESRKKVSADQRVVKQRHNLSNFASSQQI